MAQWVKKPLQSSCNEGDTGSFPGLGRSSGERNGNLLKYSGLEKSVDRGAWWAAVHGITKSWTWLSSKAHSIAHRWFTGGSEGGNILHTNNFTSLILKIPFDVVSYVF